MSVRHIMMGPCHFLVKYRHISEINKIVDAFITAILWWTKGIWETVTKIVYFLRSFFFCFDKLMHFWKGWYHQLCHSRLAIGFSFNLMYHMFKSVEGIMFNWHEIARTLKHIFRNFIKNILFWIYLHHTSYVVRST